MAQGSLVITLSSNSDEFDDAHFCGISATRAGLGDPGVTAVHVSILRSDLVEELLRDIFLGDIGKDLSLGSKIVLLGDGDHLFDNYL